MTTPRIALLTVEEVAQVLRLSRRSIFRLLAEKQLRGSRLRGRRVLIRQSDVERYVERSMS